MPVFVGLAMVSCLFLSVPLITSGVLLNRDECKAACRLLLIIPNWRNIHAKKVGVVSAHSMKACTRLAVLPVVFTDVQITIRQGAAVLPVLRTLLLLAYTKQIMPLIGCS
jgi:hypothetical protein